MWASAGCRWERRTTERRSGAVPLRSSPGVTPGRVVPAGLVPAPPAGCVRGSERKTHPRDRDHQRRGLWVFARGTNLCFFRRMKNGLLHTVVAGDRDVLFPVAAESNGCEPSCLKTRLFSDSSGRRRSHVGLTGLEARCQSGCDPSGGPGRV